MDEQIRAREIDVERINLVDPDGTVRLTIANQPSFPSGRIHGEEVQPAGSRGPGMLLFDENGDECGGFIWGLPNQAEGSAGAIFSLDRRKQDQVVALTYHEAKGRYGSGLMVWDRPATPLNEELAVRREAQDLPPAQRDEALAEIEGGHARRLFAGRDGSGAAAVVLSDSKGRPRIRLLVDDTDEPRIEVLDADGNVTWTLPPSGGPAGA